MPQKYIKTKFLKLKSYAISHEFVLAILITVIFVCVGTFFGAYNNKVVPLSTGAISRYTAEPNNPLSFLSNWDGPDYIQIANHGYTLLSQTNFFPLYPLLIHVVNKVISSPLDSALLISWLCLVGAIYFYLKIIKLIFRVEDNLKAIKGLLFFILFPTAIFLLATYTESLFAFLSLGAIYAALRSRYLSAALFALFATATHDNGVFVVVLICLILLEQRVKLQKVIISFVIGLLGLLGYMYFLFKKFNAPFGFVSAQKSHGWLTHGYISNPLGSIDVFNVVFVILIVFSIIYWWRRRKSFAIYSALFLLIPLAGGQFGGFNRYCLMVFPIQFMLYEKLHNKSLGYAVTIIFLAISWTYFLLQYAGGYVGG